MAARIDSEPAESMPSEPRSIAPPPIELGTLLFTAIEPHKGREVEYNRWYEYDHFYAGCMVGAHQFAGRRFVATRRLKALRSPHDSPLCPDPSAASYLSIYWVLKGFHDEWSRWAVRMVKQLHAADRMFPDRDHTHTALYEHRSSMRRNAHGTAIELALDRDFDGLVVTAGELNADATLDDLDRWMDTTWSTRAFASAWGPEVVGTSTLLPLPGDAPGVPGVAGSDRRFLQLHFLDHDPEVDWPDGYGRWGADFEVSGLGTHIWTAPYIPTVMGTDTYTDELW
ncbi:MAG: hypothetical protein QNM02_17230 [Acidimicrobiia bacterium]|nr:hypothetical protein [Acidimicrobiia bacterium]